MRSTALSASAAVGIEVEPRHCEERSDEAIHGERALPYDLMDCFASLAMTDA